MNDEFIGDWVCCLESILKNYEIVIDNNLMDLNYIILKVIEKATLPIHSSMLALLDAWMKRCVSIQSNSNSYKAILLPIHIEQIILPLRNYMNYTTSNSSFDFLPSLLACFCTLLQRTMLYEHMNTFNYLDTIVLDLFSVDPRNLPLHLVSKILRNLIQDQAQSSIQRKVEIDFANRFLEMIENFCPELNISFRWIESKESCTNMTLHGTTLRLLSKVNIETLPNLKGISNCATNQSVHTELGLKLVYSALTSGDLMQPTSTSYTTLLLYYQHWKHIWNEESSPQTFEL